MTSEELERLEELEELVELGELDKEDDPDTWEELQDLRSTRRAKKSAEKVLAKWRKAKTVLYVSLRDPDPDADISFYVYDRAGFEAVTKSQCWPDELISAVTVTEVDPKTVGDVRYQEFDECFYSVADLERWQAIERENNEKWEREHPFTSMVAVAKPKESPEPAEPERVVVATQAERTDTTPTVVVVGKVEPTDTAIVPAGETLAELVGSAKTFDTSILAGGKSPNTIEQYRLHWNAYFAYAGAWEMVVQPATLARWRQYLFEAGYSTKDGHKPYTVNAINLRLASVRSVIAAAAEQGYVDRTTAEAFKAIRGLKQKANKERRRENNRTPITRAQMDDICNAPNAQTGAGLMHRAFLLTMRGTGARITDVVSMKTADITRHTNEDGVTGWAVKFQGKNESEPVFVEISAGARAAIDRWLGWRRLAGVQSEYVFTGFTGRGDRSPSGKPISRVSAWEMVQRYAKRVGLEHIKPHDFRRYVGTQLAKKDIRLAQKQLRHKRIETTAQNYVLDDVHLGHMDSI